MMAEIGIGICLLMVAGAVLLIIAILVVLLLEGDKDGE
jgi:hypothetical protein